MAVIRIGLQRMGKVVFNSLKYSKCVSEGKATEARIIKIKGVK